MSDHPDSVRPNVSDTAPQKVNCAATAILGLAGLGVLLFVFDAFFPALGHPKWVHDRSECRRHLVQIGRALHSYHDMYGAFPPAYTVDAAGKPLHSWRTLVLPFLGHAPLYDKIDLSKPFNHPANSEAYRTDLWVFRCPGARYPANSTTYLAIMAPGGVFLPRRPRKLSEMRSRTVASTR